MKQLLLLLACLIAALSGEVFAGNGYATRYYTSYDTWDSGFHSHYSYSERTVTTTTTTTTYEERCYGYNTCYSGYTSTSRVYVEESIVESGSYAGYTQVTVYNDRRYRPSDRYVTYYTHNGRVVHRNFHHHHPHYHDHYYYNDYYHHHVDYVVIDRFTAEIILGMHFFALGLNVASHCRQGDDACWFLAMASSVSASAISISASIREQRRTDLQRRIEGRDKIRDNQDLNDSIDEDLNK